MPDIPVFFYMNFINKLMIILKWVLSRKELKAKNNIIELKSELRHN